MKVEAQNITAEGGASSSGSGSAAATNPVVDKTTGPLSFMDSIKSAMAAKKQQYGNVPGSANSSPSGADPIKGPDGQPLNTSADPLAAVQGPSQINMDPYDQLKKEAGIWVFAVDLAASRGLKFWSKTGTVDEYKLNDSEKNDLTIALADYFATLQQTPKMPPWIVLAVTVAMIYGAKALSAHSKRTESKRKKKVAVDPSAPEHVEIKPAVKVETKNHDRRPRNTSKPAKKKADRKPKFDPSKPYWDQQWNNKGLRIFNPIDANENERRKLNGGALCLNCQTNYAKAGKNACSTHCNGKLNKKNNVGSEAIS